MKNFKWFSPSNAYNPEGNYFNGCDDLNELIIFQRNILENCRVKMLRRLAELYEKAGEYAPCLETLVEIADLAYIAPRIAFFCGAECPRSEYVPEVRIVRGFLHLLEGVYSRRSLRLRIRRASDMDQSSLRVLQYLKDRQVEELEIQMELP